MTDMETSRRMYDRHDRYGWVSLIAIVSALFAIGRAQTIPPFTQRDCITYRQHLINHTATSFFDRRHSTNLGIASLVLFWTGPFLSLPLSVAAIWTGRRMQTAALEEMKRGGVTDENWELVEYLCARLMNERQLDVVWGGRNEKAIVMGGVGVALGGFVGMVMCCWGVVAREGGRSADSDEDE